MGLVQHLKLYSSSNYSAGRAALCGEVSTVIIFPELLVCGIAEQLAGGDAACV